MKKLTVYSVVLALVVMLGVSSMAGADAITINNHSFDGEASYPRYATPTGWSMGGSTGTGRTGDHNTVSHGMIPGGGDGTYCAYLNAEYPPAGDPGPTIFLYQNTSATFVAGWTYTLTALIGMRSDASEVAGGLPWEISLHNAADDTEIASETGTVAWANSGVFYEYSLEYVATAADAGKTIRVRLTNATDRNGSDANLIQMQLDNVRLDGVIPEPTSAGILLFAAVALLRRGKNRRA